jgi:hypothetical protein
MASVSASAARSRSVKNGVSRQALSAYRRCSVSPAAAGVLSVHVDAVGAAVDHRGAHLHQLQKRVLEARRSHELAQAVQRLVAVSPEPEQSLALVGHRRRP